MATAMASLQQAGIYVIKSKGIAFDAGTHEANIIFPYK